MFDTKIAFIVRNDLATWQRMNVVAFLATGIASAAPEILGKPQLQLGVCHCRWTAGNRCDCDSEHDQEADDSG